MADEDDPARAYRAYLEEWLEREDAQRALRPTVTRMLGTAAWQVEAMDALQSTSPGMAREMNNEMLRALTNLQRTLPLPVRVPNELPTSISSASAVTGAKRQPREN